jgi:tight adherence protein B
MLFFIMFLAVLALSFTAVLLLTGKTSLERAVGQRVDLVRIAHPDKAADPRNPERILKQDRKIAFPRLEEFLDRYGIASRLRNLVTHAGSSWTLGAFCLYSLTAASFVFFVTYIFSPIIPLDIVLAFGAACVPFLFLTRQSRKRLQAFDKGLPDAIDMMARALRAGHSVNSAIELLSEQAAPVVALEFQAVFRQQNFGLPLRDALLDLASRVPSKDLRFWVTAMLVQKETGGNLTEILDRAAHVIRERVRIAGEVRVRTAQGRMTGWILSLLPVILLVLLNMVNPGYSGVLLHSPTGRKLLYAGAAMIAVGSFIIRKIVDIKV